MERRICLQLLGGAVASHAQSAPAAAPIPLATSLGEKLLQPWQNGFLPVLAQDRRTITILDANGLVASTFTVGLPDLGAVSVGAVAVSATRSLALSASGRSPDGSLATLLLFAGLDGTPVRTIRTAPFAAGRLLFAPNGNLLCIGREFDPSHGIYADVPEHPILRIYSPDGQLLSKSLPVESFIATAKQPHPLGWLAAAGKDRLGLLDPDSLRYAEFAWDGALVRPPEPLGLASPVRLLGFAILPNGDRFVSTALPIVPGRRGGIAQHRLTGPPGHPVSPLPVPDIALPEGYSGLRILGTQDDSIVFLTSPVAALVRLPVTTL